MIGNQHPQTTMSYAKLFASMNGDEVNQILANEDKGQNLHILILCGDLQNKENLQTMNNLNSLNKGNKRVYIHSIKATPKIAMQTFNEIVIILLFFDRKLSTKAMNNNNKLNKPYTFLRLIKIQTCLSQKR